MFDQFLTTWTYEMDEKNIFRKALWQFITCTYCSAMRQSGTVSDDA
jgi:hypothetical protein